MSASEILGIQIHKEKEKCSKKQKDSLELMRCVCLCVCVTLWCRLASSLSWHMGLFLDIWLLQGTRACREIEHTNTQNKCTYTSKKGMYTHKTTGFGAVCQMSDYLCDSAASVNPSTLNPRSVLTHTYTHTNRHTQKYSSNQDSHTSFSKMISLLVIRVQNKKW